MSSNPVTPGQPIPMDPSEFTAASVPNVTSFALQGIQPPSEVYVQRDDQIMGFVSTLLPGGETVTITTRVLLAAGPMPGQPSGDGSTTDNLDVTPTQATIHTVQKIVHIPGGQNFTSYTITLAEGYLLSVGIAATALMPGTTRVTAFIARGAAQPTTAVPWMILVDDYPVALQPAGWPPITQIQAGGTFGFINEEQFVPPGAGSDVSITFSNAVRTRLLSLNFALNTSATVANRAVQFQLASGSGGFNVCIFGPGVSQPASKLWFYSASLGQVVINDTAVNNALYFPMPEVVLAVNDILQTVTANLQAGDQFSQVMVAVEQWT